MFNLSILKKKSIIQHRLSIVILSYSFPRAKKKIFFFKGESSVPDHFCQLCFSSIFIIYCNLEYQCIFYKIKAGSSEFVIKDFQLFWYRYKMRKTYLHHCSMNFSFINNIVFFFNTLHSKNMS